MTPTLNWNDKIAVVDLGGDENRFSPQFLDTINEQIDEIEAAGAQGLVTTAHNKFYTNGLDLDWLTAHGEQAQSYVAPVQGPVGARPDAADADGRGATCVNSRPPETTPTTRGPDQQPHQESSYASPTECLRLQNLDLRQAHVSQAGQALPCITGPRRPPKAETSRLAAAVRP
jgi:hypothetical protein